MMFEIILFVSVLLGQLGRIQLTPQVALYAHDIALALFALVSVMHLLRYKEKRKSWVLVVPFLFVSIVCIFSLLVNAGQFTGNEVVVGSAYAARFIAYFGLYFLVRSDHHTSTYWLTWLFLLGLAFAGLGLIQINVYPDLRNLSYEGWDPHYYRLFATLLDPNFMGSILVVTFIAGVAVFKRAAEKIWSVAGLSVIFVAFLLTFSRSSYVAAIAALLSYIIISGRWRYLYFLLFLCAAIVAVPAIGGESTALFRQLTALARIANWQEGIQLFLKSPIIGYGFNMIGSLAHNASTLTAGTVARSTSGYDNSIVFILVTTGIVGLVAFANLGIKIIGIGRRAMQKKNNELGILYITACIGILAHSMFVNTVFYPQMMLCFWIFTAAVEKEGK